MATLAGSETSRSRARDPEKALAGASAAHDAQNRGYACQTADKAEDGGRERQPEATLAQSTKWYSKLDPRRGKKPLLLGTRSSEWLIQLCVGFGVFVDLCIYGIAAPVIPFRLEHLGYSDVESLTGWLVAAYAGGLIVSSPFIGYLGEKVKNRQGPLLLSLTFMAGALVMFMLSKTFTLLLISRILQGVSGTGIWTIGLALLADCVPEERLALAMGNVMVGLSLGGFSGPPIGGALYQQLGYYAPWIFSIAIVVVDAILRLVMIEPKKAVKWKESAVDNIPAPLVVQDDGTPKPSPTMAFLGLCYNTRALTSMLISFSVGIYMGGILDGALTLKLKDRYGLNSQGAGLVFIANGVPALICSPIAGWITDKYGQRYIVLVALIGFCIVQPFLCVDSMNLVAFCAVLAFNGGLVAIQMPGISIDLAQITTETPGLGYAHSFSMFNIAFSLGSFVGPIASGQLLQRMGIENGFYTVVAISELFFLLCIPMVIWKFPKPSQKAKAAAEVTTREDRPT